MTETDFGEQLARIQKERDDARFLRLKVQGEIEQATGKLGELCEYLSSEEYVRRPDDIGLYFRVANIDYLRGLVNQVYETTKTIKRIDKQLS